MAGFRPGPHIRAPDRCFSARVTRVLRPSTDQQTILLAEENAPLREVLSGLLAEAGHRVIAVGGAQALIEQLRAPIRIDVLITDTRIRGLPGWQCMPAWEVIQEATWRRPGIPVLQLIDSRADAMPRCSGGAGPVRLLQKPFSVTALLEAITALVPKGRASSPGEPTNPESAPAR